MPTPTSGSGAGPSTANCATCVPRTWRHCSPVSCTPLRNSNISLDCLPPLSWTLAVLCAFKKSQRSNAKYPQLTYNRVTVVSFLASHRQKLRRTAWEGWASSGDSPSLEELKSVKEMADERGGLAKVAALSEQVDELAKAAGGFDKLKAA